MRGRWREDGAGSGAEWIGKGKTSIGTHQTPKTRMVAALTALGIPLDAKQPFLEVENLGSSAGGKDYYWNVAPSTLPGVNPRRVTSEMVSLWGNPKLIEAHPEHPLSYIRAAFENHARLLDIIRGDRRMVQWERKGKMLFLPESATPAEEAEWVSRMR